MTNDSKATLLTLFEASLTDWLDEKLEQFVENSTALRALIDQQGKTARSTYNIGQLVSDVSVLRRSSEEMQRVVLQNEAKFNEYTTHHAGAHTDIWQTVRKIDIWQTVRKIEQMIGTIHSRLFDLEQGKVVPQNLNDRVTKIEEMLGTVKVFLKNEEDEKNLDLDKVAEKVAQEMAARIDASDVAKEFRVRDIASEIDIDDLAEEINLKDLAEEINLDDLAAELVKRIAEKLQQ